MNFLLIDSQKVKNCLAYIGALKTSGKWEVTIAEYKKSRSKSQNRLMWSWINIMGNHFGYDKDDMHDEFKYAFLGEESYVNRRGVERVKPKSTTKLTTKEMAEYLTKIEILAHKEEIKLPIPDDYAFALMRG